MHHHFVSVTLSAPHCRCKRLRPGCRAAAGGWGPHGPERFRRMAAASCCGVLGSGEVNRQEVGTRRVQVRLLNDGCRCCFFRCMSQSCWCLMEQASTPRPSWRRPPSVYLQPHHSLTSDVFYKLLVFYLQRTTEHRGLLTFWKDVTLPDLLPSRF